MENNPFGITAIGTYIPDLRIDNGPRAERFDYAPDALTEKIGMRATARKQPDEMASDLCLKAFQDLSERLDAAVDLDTIDLIVVVTQHPDNYGLPHCSSIVHGALGLPASCFAFDISLGCSGYVSALATVSGHLAMSGGKRALLFTADPYSVSLDEEDRNTAMIFGDAATVSLIEPDGAWRMGHPNFGTKSSLALQRDEDGCLRMDGRAVFNFCALNVPKSITQCLDANGLSKDQIDTFILHPGSKYISDTIAKRLGIDAVERLPCEDYGNTVSSSLPLILADLPMDRPQTVVVSGFGVGLGWATNILKLKVKS